MTATMTRPAANQILSRGPYVIEWIERNCVFTKGRWRGQPFVLLPWQKRELVRLYEVDENGRRIKRRGLLGIPKKQGKSELAGALACFAAAGDREIAPEVYVAANNDDQADLVFGSAKTMCELSPTLSRISETYARQIVFPGTHGSINRVSSKAKTKDGLNVSFGIFDEFHEFADGSGEELYNVISNGVGARLEPMTLAITTAGYDLDTLCGRMYQYGQQVEAGTIDDPAFYFRWHTAPETLDYREPDAWRAANPSYGVTVLPEFYEDQIKAKPEGVFRRYFLNQWTETETLWLPAGAWDGCRTVGMTLDPDAPVVLGWDAARNRDSTAVVTGQRIDGRVRLQARIWERPINPANGQPVEGWVTPTAEVTNHIRQMASDYTVKRVGYDPWGIKESVQQLETEGLPMEEVPQTNARMIPATEYLYELITDGVIEHDGDPAFARQMRNVAARAVPNGIRMDKTRNKKPMDAGIAAAIVAYLLQSEPDDDAEPQIMVFE